MEILSKFESNTRSLNGATSIDCTALFSLAVGASVDTTLATNIAEAIANGTANLYHKQTITMNGKAYELKYPVIPFKISSGAYGIFYDDMDSGHDINRHYVGINYNSGWKINQIGTRKITSTEI